MLEAHPSPSVAVVHGAAFGAGCELACACDFRVGAPDTVLCMPPVRLGVVYAPDGVWRVARLAGLQRARWMFLTAAEVSSAEALAWGLLDVVADDAAARAHALATTLAAGAPLAMVGLRRTFRALGRAADRPRRARGARGAAVRGVRLGGRPRGPGRDAREAAAALEGTLSVGAPVPRRRPERVRRSQGTQGRAVRGGRATCPRPRTPSAGRLSQWFREHRWGNNFGRSSPRGGAAGRGPRPFPFPGAPLRNFFGRLLPGSGHPPARLSVRKCSAAAVGETADPPGLPRPSGRGRDRLRRRRTARPSAGGAPRRSCTAS